MPCYDPPVTANELQDMREQAAARGDLKAWYVLTREAGHPEQWLCDILRGNPPHADCLKWWEIHKFLEQPGKRK